MNNCCIYLDVLLLINTVRGELFVGDVAKEFHCHQRRQSVDLAISRGGIGLIERKPPNADQH